jgi:hypothetical protein
MGTSEEGDAMRVFIGWSGDRSEKIVTFLDGWIPKIIQRGRPFISAGIIDLAGSHISRSGLGTA